MRSEEMQLRKTTIASRPLLHKKIACAKKRRRCMENWQKANVRRGLKKRGGRADSHCEATVSRAARKHFHGVEAGRQTHKTYAKMGENQPGQPDKGRDQVGFCKNDQALTRRRTQDVRAMGRGRGGVNIREKKARR